MLFRCQPQWHLFKKSSVDEKNHKSPGEVVAVYLPDPMAELLRLIKKLMESIESLEKQQLPEAKNTRYPAGWSWAHKHRGVC